MFDIIQNLRVSIAKSLGSILFIGHLPSHSSVVKMRQICMQPIWSICIYACVCVIYTCSPFNNCSRGYDYRFPIMLQYATEGLLLWSFFWKKFRTSTSTACRYWMTSFICTVYESINYQYLNSNVRISIIQCSMVIGNARLDTIV